MKIIITIITLLMLTATATAHSGRTNSQGCHNNRKTGGYHCHGGGAAKPKPKIAPLNLNKQITGTTSRVIDGDTFVVNGRKIRLCGINAPEKNQRGGHQATQHLKQLIGSRFVSCKIVGSGTPCDGRSNATSYDRIVAQCFVGGEDVACLMVESGNARDSKRYSGGHYQRRCLQRLGLKNLGM